MKTMGSLGGGVFLSCTSKAAMVFSHRLGSGVWPQAGETRVRSNSEMESDLFMGIMVLNRAVPGATGFSPRRREERQGVSSRSLRLRGETVSTQSTVVCSNRDWHILILERN